MLSPETCRITLVAVDLLTQTMVTIRVVSINTRSTMIAATTEDGMIAVKFGP